MGGVESTIYHHARLLSEAGHEVSIIAGRGSAFSDEIPFRLIPEIDSRHQKVERINHQLAQGKISEDFTNLRDSLVESLINSMLDSDALIVHNAVTLHKNLALTAALKIIAERGQPRMLAWCHDFAWQDSLYTPDLHPGYPWDLLRTPWEGITYVTVSEHRQRRLQGLLGLQPEEIHVIPPGVDTIELLDLSPLAVKLVDKFQLSDAEPIILLPARITRRKNIEFAIQVIAHLKQSFPLVALIITGPPGPHNPKNIEYLEMLLEMRTSLQLDPNVHFVYQLNGEDAVFNAPDDLISELYRISDMVLFPSFREGFGIPVLEAGLVRVPIFASDIGPIRESSAGMINLFKPTDDAGQVAEKIQDYLDANLAYQFRRRVINNYTWQAILRNKILPLLEGD